jgi:hypothetical protein
VGEYSRGNFVTEYASWPALGSVDSYLSCGRFNR